MNFLKPLVDLKDFGHRELGWDAPKHFLDNTLMARWLNQQPVPDAKRVELSKPHLEEHLNGTNAYYFKAHPRNSRVLLCVDIDAHDGQTDCKELTDFVERTWFPGVYFEPSPRGYHGYFLLDLKGTSRDNLKDIIRRLWLTMEARRKAEGFASDIDQIKGRSQIPLKVGGVWCFPKNSGRRGTLAKLPMLPQGRASLESLKDTAVFPIDYLSFLVQADSPRVSSTGFNGTPTLSDSLGTSYRESPVAKSLNVDLSDKQPSKTNPNEHIKNRDTLRGSPTTPPVDTIDSPLFTLLESDPPALRAYREAREQHATDPEGRMWQAHFIASRVQPSALESPETLMKFYHALGFKGRASIDATLERARRVTEKRKGSTATNKKLIFNRDQWLPIIERHITKELIKDPRNWYPSSTKRSIRLDSLAAVLCLMTANILNIPEDPRHLFSVADDQIAGFLKACHGKGAVSSALKKEDKRFACVSVLQLAGLIVLRNGQWTRPRITPQGEYISGIPKKYGLGLKHPQYSLFVSFCKSLGEDPFKIDTTLRKERTN